MLTFVSRLILPAVVTGIIAALIMVGNSSPVTLATCRITARWQGAWIFVPDCTNQPPASSPGPSPPVGVPNSVAVAPPRD
jgi:hypothetical protein